VKVKLEISYNAVREHAGGNDTVPISVWRGGGKRRTECRCSYSWFVVFLVLKWSVWPRVRAFWLLLLSLLGCIAASARCGLLLHTEQRGLPVCLTVYLSQGGQL